MSESDTGFVRGQRLHFREISDADMPTYHRWMNDPDVTKYLESRFRPWSMEALRKYIAQQWDAATMGLMAVVRSEDNRYIGNIRLSAVNWPHRSAGVGLLIGDADCRGLGYGTEAIQLLSRFAFETLNLRKLSAGVYASNVPSLRAFIKAGFVEEGRQREHWFDNGTYVDGIMLGLLKGH